MSSPSSIDPDDCCVPIDLKSESASLPDQSSMSFDGSNPKADSMQKMIDERYSTDNDQWSGMKNTSKGSGIPK
jgi:hypothetical protein